MVATSGREKLPAETVQPLPAGQKGPFVRNRSSVRNNLILVKQNLTITIVCNSGWPELQEETVRIFWR
jgi:hypothetical protein